MSTDGPGFPHFFAEQFLDMFPARVRRRSLPAARARLAGEDVVDDHTMTGRALVLIEAVTARVRLASPTMLAAIENILQKSVGIGAAGCS
jgi:hypothetical protein